MQHALDEAVDGDGRVEQLPRVQSVIEGTWDDEWTALYLEFVLYARRNPALREKLAATARREYDDTIGMLEAVYAGIGATPNHPMPVLARVSMALFEGLALGRLVDPASYTQDTFTDALLFLYDTIGVDAPPDERVTRRYRARRGSRPRFSHRIDPKRTNVSRTRSGRRVSTWPASLASGPTR